MTTATQLGRESLQSADVYVATVDVATASNARDHGRPRLLVLSCALVLLGAAAATSAVQADQDGARDLLSLLTSSGHDLAHLRWQFLTIVVSLAGLHYLATAIAARASAGVRLPLGETVVVQLAAAAANRLTPFGIGGSALTARYFHRRGLDTPGAIGAVAALGILGALADVLVLTALVAIGSLAGLNGASRELSTLDAKAGRLVSSVGSPWVWCGVAVVAAAVVASRLRLRRVPGGGHWSRFWTPVRRLIRRPAALACLLVASGSTTLVLGFAFVASTSMVPGPQPRIALGALLVAFMVGAAAGNATPIPAGLGTTEAALIGVLVAARVPAAHAIQEVLIFRLVTFWLPAVIGILAMRLLRRRDAL